MPVASGQPGEGVRQAPAGSDRATEIQCRRYLIISLALPRFHITHLFIPSGA